MEVIGDRDEIESRALCQLGDVEQARRIMFLAGECQAELQRSVATGIGYVLVIVHAFRVPGRDPLHTFLLQQARRRVGRRV